MRKLIILLTGGIASGFLLAGCGQAGDAGSLQDSASAGAEENIPEGAEMVSLKVEGMTWTANCVPAVQSALAKVEGVQDVKVDLKDGKASIIAAKGKGTADQLIKAVADIPGGWFKATPN